MSDLEKQRIYSAEQIKVHPDLTSILKAYSKEIIRNNPENLVDFSSKYFKDLIVQRGKVQNEFSELQKPDSISKLK